MCKPTISSSRTSTTAVAEASAAVSSSSSSENVAVADPTTTTAILREGKAGKTVQGQIFYNSSATTPTTPKQSYTIEEVTTKSKEDEDKLWIVIHDRVYDLTEFQHTHPGGQLVLKHMKGGKDATDAFENYHRAHVSRYILPKFYVGDLKREETEQAIIPDHVVDFRKLKQELLEKGLFQVPSTYYYKLYFWLTTLFLGSIYCTIYGQSTIIRLVGSFLLGLFWQQFAGLGHDLGHTAGISKDYDQNHYVGSTIGSILTGLSTCWWKHNHNTHHIVPNSVEDDPNIQHLPMLAISESIIEQPYVSTYHNRQFILTRVSEWIVSYQHYIFLPLMCLARFNLYILGIKHLLNPQLKTKYTNTEIICILGIFPIWYTMLISYLPNRNEKIAFVIMSHATTILLHLQIVVSHWSMDTYNRQNNYKTTTKAANSSSSSGDGNDVAAADVQDDDDDDDWYTLQLRTTMDIDCYPYLDWLHIGLQFQTAHHIFPTLPRPHLRHATEMIKEVCTKHNIPFYSMPFLPMVGDSLRVLQETAILARTGKYTTSQGGGGEVTKNYLAEALRAQG